MRFRGDLFECALTLSAPAKGTAWLRTNIGMGKVRRAEIIGLAEEYRPILARDWHDIRMRRVDDLRFAVALPLAEVGYFEAKAFFLPDEGLPVWPEGPNVTVKVEPAETACACTLYTAFVRQFGPSRFAGQPADDARSALAAFDAAGYAVIPRSGTFRDLKRELDFILGQLRCRIVQLLPIHPVPTTYARMGRFGSPFAALDFMDVDPALAEFDRRTTPLDQFRELADAIHERHGRLFIDLPINHTGWASWLQIHHPHWFARAEDRSFQSPGAWGVTWEDLAKLDYRSHGLWAYMAEVFLHWCRQGVDGFRCDAGYMIPFPVWQYLVAKVRAQYPDTVFMLEGLGGTMEATDSLLAGANLNWAYSELFQTYDQRQMESYLPGCILTSTSVGTLVHFAETHDNARLAAGSPAGARFRTVLSALLSHNGAFGITNGLEWLATERIAVHEAPSLNWGAADNQVALIGRLNAILEAHPCFHENAGLQLIHSGQYNTLALLRAQAADGSRLLAAANFNDGRPSIVVWPRDRFDPGDATLYDLVTAKPVAVERHETTLSCLLQPHEAVCLTERASDLEMIERALAEKPGMPEHIRARCLRAKAIEVYGRLHPAQDVGPLDVPALAASLARNPRLYCAEAAGVQDPPVVCWVWPRDVRRVVMLPPGHFLSVTAPHHFLAEICDGVTVLSREWSIAADDGRPFALLAPAETMPDEAVPAAAACAPMTLRFTLYEPGKIQRAEAPLLRLPADLPKVPLALGPRDVRESGAYALCANGRGAMAQVRGNWSELRSQYDSLLAANLSPDFPVDRHIMLTRCRAWLVYRGYSQEIGRNCQQGFTQDDSGAVFWNFEVPCGMGKSVPLVLTLTLLPGRNAITLACRRGMATASEHLDDGAEVSLIIRPDLEDRVCHAITKAYAGPEQAWPAAIHPQANGFDFAPAADRCLRVAASSGTFIREPKWQYMIPHPFEADRGLNGNTDLFSPGYFTLTLKGGEEAVVSAEVDKGEAKGFRQEERSGGTPTLQGTAGAACARDGGTPSPASAGLCPPAPNGGAGRAQGTSRRDLCLPDVLRRAIRNYIVKRDDSLTVIAGYPWFLDWGRDTMICLRGIIAAGMLDDARQILYHFAGFESQGTLPNMIRGNDASDRDTSDTPLWFFVACADLLRATRSQAFLDADCRGRTLREVLHSIASSYVTGTPNGIGMDPTSGLIFSPSHFTWMDTNYPSGTPREGYPIEIQALWHAALRFMAQLESDGNWIELAARVQASILRRYVRPDLGFLADCLHARRGESGEQAAADDALRPNQLLAITLGAVSEPALVSAMLSACEELLVPGAIRSLADRPVMRPLPVVRDGRPLNDPQRPYWGSYRGDEDTRRKPAYHNGTAWTWLFPSYSEALLLRYGSDARAKARALLASSARLLEQGCIAQVPEIVDGDAPHTQRGCGAQAWGVTELFRVLWLTG